MVLVLIGGLCLGSSALSIVLWVVVMDAYLVYAHVTPSDHPHHTRSLYYRILRAESSEQRVSSLPRLYPGPPKRRRKGTCWLTNFGWAPFKRLDQTIALDSPLLFPHFRSACRAPPPPLLLATDLNHHLAYARALPTSTCAPSPPVRTRGAADSRASSGLFSTLSLSPARSPLRKLKTLIAQSSPSTRSPVSSTSYRQDLRSISSTLLAVNSRTARALLHLPAPP